MRHFLFHSVHHSFEAHPTMSKEAEDFYTSLCELTPHNNRPHINMLAMLASDYKSAAPSIVSLIENHIKQVQGEKIHFLYLVDSIVKTVGGDYIPLFARNMPAIFSSVFYKADEKTRLQLHKLRNTWVDVFPVDKLFQLDLKVNSLDSNWPIAPCPRPKIHVNPHFVKALGTGRMREKLLKEKKELLELEKRKVELQILQTKKVLDDEKKKLESYATNIKSDGTFQIPYYAMHVPVDGIVSPPPQKRKLDLICSRDPRLMNKETFSNPEAETKKPCLRNAQTEAPRDISHESVISEPHQGISLQPLPVIDNLESTQSLPDDDRIVSLEHPPLVTNTSPVSSPITAQFSPETENISTSDILLVNEENPSEFDTNAAGLELPSMDDPGSVSSLNVTLHEVTDMVIAPADELVEETVEENVPSEEPTHQDTDVIATEVDNVNEPSHSPSSLVKDTEEITDDNIVKSTQGEVVEKSDLLNNSIDDITTSALPWSPKEREESLTPVSLSSESYPSPKSGSSTTSQVSVIDSPLKIDEKYTFRDEPVPGVTKMDSSVKPVLTASPLLSSGDPGKDVDLRSSYLTPPSVFTSEETVISSEPNQDNVMIGLFGVKDVDLRQPPLPSPPPPPHISEDITNNKTWAKIKQTDLPRPEKIETFSPRMKRDKDRLGRPWRSYNADSISKTREKQSEERARNNYNFIINEAQEQLQNGIISFVEYNTMLNEVVAINEEQKIKDAKKGCYRYFSEECSDLNDTNENPVEGNTSLPKDKFLNEYPAYEDLSSNIISSFSRTNYESQSYEREWANRGSKRGRDGGRVSVPTPPPPVVGPMPWKGPPNLSPCDNFVPPSSPFSGLHTNVPLADRKLLTEAEMVANDFISIGPWMGDIRFYGDIGIVLLSWDDPREICFQPGSRHLIVDSIHKFLLQFGGQSVEISIDGCTSFVRLGRPTRELFVDDKYYSIGFGAPPVDIIICGKTRSIMLEGPPPVVRYGQIKRTDLCGGTVKLIRDGKVIFPVYLDSKPQKFEIEGVPCVIQFVDHLSTVLINGAPVPITFGGQPVPIMFQGREHFLRLSMLPAGIIPGQRCSSSPDQYHTEVSSDHMIPPALLGSSSPHVTGSQPNVPQQPLDILASVLSTKTTGRFSGVSYKTEEVPEAVTSQLINTNDKSVNIGELYRKLINSGLVSTDHTNERCTPKEMLFLPDVSLSYPETLKMRPAALITQLYEGIQCSTCGVRFPSELGTKKYSNHLDWHFRQNRKEKASTKTPHSRNWYYDLSDLIQLQDVDDLEEGIDLNEDNDDDLRKDAGEESLEDQPSVPVGDYKHPKCALCEDQFEEFFNDEKEEWHIRNAVIVEEGILHPRCFEEMKKKKALGLPTATEGQPMEESDTSPETSFNMEVIEIIDSDALTQPSDKDTQESKETVEDKVETINVDLTEDDNSEIPNISAVNEEKDESTKEVNIKSPHQNDEDDDDILQIEVIERKIESYDLLDDEDDKVDTEEGEKELNKESDELETDPVTEIIDDDIEVDFSNFKVKQEKESPVEIIDTSVPTYIATIDGNIIHEKTAPLIAPGRIKINISSAMKNTIGGESPSSKSSDSNDDVSFPDPQELPDEDVRPSKPGIDRSTLSREATVIKGKETSGLCVIM